jgi:hypothetical protein
MTPPPTGNPETSPNALEASALSMPRAADSNTRRRVAAAPPQTRAYPLLLLISTAVAALFCFMYITKPVLPITPALVISQGPAAAPALTSALENVTPSAATGTLPLTAPDKSALPATRMLPDAKRLPGDPHAALAAKPPQPSDPRRALPGTGTAPTFEETNLRIQHVLTAEAPGGDLSRIVLNVPVLYKSRNLGWTDREVAASRELLNRLSTYQENTRILRDEGTKLLAAWNLLIEHSIPTPVLRADSPSLPANQNHADTTQQPAGLDTTESIQIQPSEK